MKSIALLIGEGFPLMSLSLITEPLRVANRESLEPAFRWRILSVDGEPPRSSSGISVAINGGLDNEPTDAIIILASYAPESMISSSVLGWLRQHARLGCLMGCVDTGALILSEAGLLRLHPAAVHHEAIAGFVERRKEDFFTDRLFDLGGNRCSSAGGVVTMDMTLALIAHFESERLARRVAEILNYRPRETDRADGAFGADWSIPRINCTLAKAVELMQTNMEVPLSIRDIANRLGWQEWKLRRLFIRYLGEPPQAYYLGLRLDMARNLLRNSHESVGKIALMCGFSASESLTRAYRSRFKVTPSHDRTFPPVSVA